MYKTDLFIFLDADANIPFSSILDDLLNDDSFQMQKLHQELDTANHKLASLKQEYSAFKKHSNDLLAQVSHDNQIYFQLHNPFMLLP